ncbi:PAS domain-containing protein [Flavobacterium chungbukense]|uniref:histidine kinase n=1 Tax=Flavobacterium chungbukense TaxID=877464 RepID=A0ABP7XNL5_9FLAO|nr:PAS domain-containing protein [Flavobacterium chungbukense]MCC4920913.1 PAS domain-containing protein [Flavobacterium chungbukense]
MSNTDYDFLANGGEMGRLTRAKDWSKTAVGAVESWPQSLRTTLGIILNSKFPMFLFWGPDHICFYNDAYRPSLGNNGKHPSILGEKGADYWPEIWDFIKPLIDKVLDKGEATWHEDQLLPIYRNGKMEDVYWTFSYSPVNNDNGKTAGVLVICNETTNQVITRKNLEESEKRFRNTVKQLPLGICILKGSDLVVEMANTTYLHIIDKTESDILNKPLFDSVPETKETAYPIIKNVLETGVPYYADEFAVILNRYRKQELGYFNLVFYPLKEDNTIEGIIVVAYEVTEEVKGRHLLTESEKAFRNIVMESPIAMAIFRGKEYIIEMANLTMMHDIWQREEKDCIGKPLLEVFPELMNQKYPELLSEVLSSGKTIRENEAVAYVDIKGKLKRFYLDYEYTTLYDKSGKSSGIMCTVYDVTSKVKARKKVETAEERARLAAEIGGIATWDLNLLNKKLIYTDNLLAIFGFEEHTKILHPDIRSRILPEDDHIVVEAYERALENGIYKYEARILKLDNSIGWIKVHGRIFFDENNIPIKMLGTVMDFTIEKNMQQVLMKSEKKFRLLADSMPQLIWTSDTLGNLNYFNETYYTYSGVSKEEIEKNGWLQIVHPDDREENVKLWMESVKSGNDFLFIHRLKRYDGDYRWQLSRAISQLDENGKIQMWVGTSTDIEEQKNFTNRLEEQILERTTQLELKNRDLVNMNIELQSFAYISSHDLQEPLRKIQTFASRLADLDEQNISAIAKTYLSRIEMSAKKMQNLIQDLLTYSRTNSAERVFTKVKVDTIAEEVVSDFSERIEEKNAVVEYSNLGEATVIQFQFRQLLHNLVENALKFSKPGIPPHVKISMEKIDGKLLPNAEFKDKTYFHLQVSDNGIGFELIYKEKIFEVFQRLNTESEYKGTGIGLAIVKKIVENHKGIISVSSEKGKGSVFNIYIPDLT